MTTLFTDIHLCAALFISILVLHSMNFQTVRFQRTALCEGLLTKIALVRPNTSVCSCVSLKIEGIVETLPTESAEVAFDITVTLHVTV